MKHSFEALIVGAGQAGPPLAGRLTAAGWTVAVVERKDFGGTCVNTGCTPTKALVASAKVAYTSRQARHYGLPAVGEFTVDLGQVQARKDAIVAASRQGVEDWLTHLAGCTIFRGTTSTARKTLPQAWLASATRPGPPPQHRRPGPGKSWPARRRARLPSS